MSEPVPSDDPRVLLAADRTIMAGERTYAAWTRTGIAALFAGVGAHAVDDLVPFAWIGVATGTVLIGFAAFCFVAAIWRQLRPGAPPPRGNIRPMPSGLLWLTNGSLALVALAGLVGLLAAEL